MKILDFGLAKAFEATTESGTESLALSPTITSPAMTERGMILGTASYMSPEQARGKTVDRRTDIWAFGCVLFELLSGVRLFKDEDVTETIVQVMSREPAWEALPAATPPAVRTLLRRCLQRDRARRLSDIHDAQLEVEDLIAGATKGDAPGSAIATTKTASPWRGMAWGLPGIAAGAKRVAYRARNADGVQLLWLRNLRTGAGTSLAGTEQGDDLFWSPDSTELGFRSGTLLKRIPADGGPTRVIAPVSGGFGAAWAPDGSVIFNRSDVEPLFRLPSGQDAKPVAITRTSREETHLWPHVLPDGQRFLFTRKSFTASADAGKQGICLGGVDGREPIELLSDLSSAVYSPTGHLVFARGGMLTAVRFDAASGLIQGVNPSAWVLPWKLMATASWPACRSRSMARWPCVHRRRLWERACHWNKTSSPSIEPVSGRRPFASVPSAPSGEFLVQAGLPFHLQTCATERSICLSSTSSRASESQSQRLENLPEFRCGLLTGRGSRSPSRPRVCRTTSWRRTSADHRHGSS